MFLGQFKLFCFFALSFFSAFGCASQNAKISASGTDSPAVSELKAKIARDGFVTFHNFEGKYIRMDGDIGLRLLPNGKAALIFNSLQLNRADGSYELDSCGTLFTKFDPEPYLGWPVLRLTRDEKSLVLRASNGDGDLHATGIYTFRPIRSANETTFKD
jgi:hypothetical protein